jgi:hypothetical protein
MTHAAISINPPAGSLPRQIYRGLRRLDRRLRVSHALSGLGWTALGMAGGAALGMAADFAWVLPQAVRWTFWIAWAALSLLAFIALVVRPLARRSRAFDLAAVAERSHPEIGEPLTGAVSLLEQSSPPHGSSALIAALAKQAADHVERIVPSRAVPWRGAATRAGAGFVALGLLTAPIAIWPQSYGTIARRFLMPWVDLDRVGLEILTVTPGDQVLPVGANLPITASLRSRFGLEPGSREAWLEWSNEGEPTTHRTAMPQASADPTEETPNRKRSEEHHFGVALQSLSRSIFYRVTSGGASSRQYHVKVLEPPVLVAIAATVELPAYTKLPVAVARDPARIDAFEGSRVTFEFTTSRPVRSIEIEWPKEPGKRDDVAAGVRAATAKASLASDRTHGSVTLTAEASGPYSVSLSDEHSITSRPESPRRVNVRPDAPPEVAVQGNDGQDEASPDDVVSLGVAARDDIAVASVDLAYTIERGGSAAVDSGQVTADVRGIGSRVVRGEAALPLGRLGLKPGDAVTYRIRVADNRPGPRGPNVVWSPVQRLAIVAAAVPLQTRRIRARRSGLRARLEQVRKATEAERQETEKLRATADQVRRDGTDWDQANRQALDQREAAAQKLEQDLERLGRDYDGDSRLRPLAAAARQIGQVEAEAARAALEKARRDGDAAARVASLEEASGRLGTVNERLANLQREFDGLDVQEAETLRLFALAKRQQAIAATPLADGDRSLFDLAQAEQNSLRNELDALLKGTPELRSSVLDAQIRQADRLASAARVLAERERDLTRRSGDLAAKNREFLALARAQRALEDDARRLAIEVDQPLAENGRGRLNADAIRQAALPIEHGEFEQARERLEGAENELRRLARDLEDVPADPKALAWRLTRRQDALNRDIDEAVRSVQGNDVAPEQKARVAEKMKSLAKRQDDIARLARSIVPPAGKEGKNRFPHDAARDAVQKTTRAAQSLAANQVKEIEGRKNEARQALERLANDLHDSWRRQEPTRQKFDEARRTSNEITEEIGRHLRETAPRSDQPSTTAHAAEELAGRLHDSADKEVRAVSALEAMEPEPRVAPQRDRALSRAQALVSLLRDLRDPTKREKAREVLANVEAEAHVAMDRLEQKLNGRAPDDDVAQELADDQAAIQQEVAKASPDALARARSRLTAGQRSLAGALRSLNVPDQALAQAEAVQLAERALLALESPDQKSDPRVALEQASDAARSLARQLAGDRAPGARAALLARAQRGLNAAEFQADPAEAASRQRAIALGLARLPIENKQSAEDLVRHAVELAERTAVLDDEHPSSSSPTREAVASARAAAAKALEDLASSAPKGEPSAATVAPVPPASSDPELRLTPTHLAAAQDLVNRERRIRQELQAILGQRAPEQRALRRESIALGRELSELRESVRPLSDRAQYPSGEAAQHLGVHAPLAMEQGAGHMAAGQARSAREAERRSAELIERGAQHAEDLATQLRAERQDARSATATRAEAEVSPPGESRLALAREAMRRAARELVQARDPTQSSHAVPAARTAMDDAARELLAAARAAAESMGAATEPRFADESSLPADIDGGDPAESARSGADQNRDPKSGPGGKSDPDLTVIQEMIRRKTGRAWGELPGHLRTEILQTAHGRFRDDYAGLIQLYFREITAGSTRDQKPE